MFDAFYQLTSLSLRELAAALNEGPLSNEISSHILQQIVGSSLSTEITMYLKELLDDGWNIRQISLLMNMIANTKEKLANPERMVDLVLSGPEVPGVPTRDTSAVMHALIENCQQEVILVGYAVHNGRKIFEHLAQKMSNMPHLKVWFCLNIPRNQNDTSLDTEIVRRFGREFSSRHWPWDIKPELFYDPRSLCGDRTERASLHAKCIIVYRKVAMITSANFTEAAQQRNIEVGVVVEHPLLIQRLADYFDALRHVLLKQCF